MNILNIFKQRKDHKHKEVTLQASATLYLDKILIETIDRVKDGFGISSTKITTLSNGIDLETLASTVRHHLSLTKSDLSIPSDLKSITKTFWKRLVLEMGKSITKTLYTW